MEYRLVGPPGSGKTRTLAAMVERDVDRLGGAAVMATSFTRAAAVELKGKDLPIPDTHVGTLHSICWRMLGRPTIAETKAAAFNEEFGYGVDVKGRNNLDDHGGGGGGGVLEEYQHARGLMDPEAWYDRGFAKDWERWKRREGYMDFTDIIETVLRDRREPPEGVERIYADEVQDLKPLEMALVRQWGSMVERHTLIGDPRQCIYEWLGCSPQLFLAGDVELGGMETLPWTHRLPRNIYNYAQGVAAELVADHGEQVFQPKREGGEVVHLGREPEEVVYDAMARDGTKMILATCGYLLGPVIRLLKDEGVPYWNPYRPDRGDWNPIRRGREGEIPTHERLIEYLTGAWADEWASEYERRISLRMWLPLVRKTGVLRRGVKLEEEFELDGLWASEEVRDIASRRLTNWIVSKAAGGKEGQLTYLGRVIERQGIEALREPPQIIVGTGHSVKGGEADHVYVLPDISSKARRAAWDGSDGLTRLLYVMVTRARESVSIASARTAHSLLIPSGLAG